MNDFVNSDWKRIYASNLVALKERYPELYDKLLTVNKDALAKSVKPNPNNPLPDIVLDGHDEKILYYGRDDPMEYCRQYLDSLDLGFAPFLVFMGFGLGYQVISALNHFSKELYIQHVIIIEKDIELFRTALMMIDLAGIIRHPEIELIVGLDPDELFKSFLKYYTRCPKVSHFFKSLKIVIMPSVRQIYADYYQKAVETLKYSVMYVLQELGNDPYDSILGIKQALCNVKHMIEAPWIISFKNALKGKPAILVGAGPSLNEDIDLLKEASQKALLVCVDAALNPLLKHGIKPHIVTNLERTKGQEAFFQESACLKDTFFVFCPVVHPGTYEAYQGPRIIANRYNEIPKWLGLNTGVLPGGPLVGNFALNIAEYLGCDPIIMVGQDLSFPPTGATHVEGMVFGVQERYRWNMFEVDGTSGGTVLTNRSFEESRRSLEKQIEEFDGLCINTTGGGAKIAGAAMLGLKQALDRYCVDSFEFSGHLKKIWTKEKENRRNKGSEERRILSILSESVVGLEKAMEDCATGIEMITTFEAKYDLLIDRKPNPEAVKTAKQLDIEINKIRDEIIFRPALKFLLYTFGGYHTDFAMKRNFVFDQFHDRRFATLKTFLMGKEWFKIIGQLLLSAIYSIKNARSRLEKEHNEHRTSDSPKASRHLSGGSN